MVKGHNKTRVGERVDIIIPPLEATDLTAEAIALDILYQDDDIIVVNKPSGLVVHPAAGHRSGTLVNALLYHCPVIAGVGGERRPGIVHRLDKDTSGVLVAAKNEQAMASLIKQFKNRQIHKDYLVLVWGHLTPFSGTIETRIGRSKHNRKKMSATTNTGRMSITKYQTLNAFDDISFLRVHPETGRTHQIRVHLAHMGHPVVGDKQYGKRPRKKVAITTQRQMLHAERLAFNHPATGQRVEFAAPLPADMALVLKKLKLDRHE